MAMVSHGPGLSAEARNTSRRSWACPIATRPPPLPPRRRSERAGGWAIVSGRLVPSPCSKCGKVGRLHISTFFGVHSSALDVEAYKRVARRLHRRRDLDCPQTVSLLRHLQVKVPALARPISLFLGPPLFITLSLSLLALRSHQVRGATAQAALYLYVFAEA